ncbi:MAG: hypothetical protein ACYCXG_00010 [Acidiferrobacter sp.]
MSTPLRLTLFAVLALAGCSTAPHPSAQPARPTLLRPLVRLTAQNLTTHGNLLIPLAALTQLGGVRGVFVLSAHHRARFRFVKVGGRKGGMAQVLSGLRPGDVLVLGPFPQICDGSPIQTPAP